MVNTLKIFIYNPPKAFSPAENNSKNKFIKK